MGRMMMDVITKSIAKLLWHLQYAVPNARDLGPV